MAPRRPIPTSRGPGVIYYRPAETEGLLAYPAKSFGTEYFLTSMGEYAKQDQPPRSTIIATQDNTVVTIVPTTALEVDGITMSSVEFSVNDNGPGIPEEKQSNIFKKFYQIDTSATRKHGGTGLGLVICKGIAEGLNGKIFLKSEFGKGTSFFVNIPAMEKKIISPELA